MDRRQLLRAAAFAGPSFCAGAAALEVAAPRPEGPAALTHASPLAARDLRQDLALIDRIYREMHPGLWRYLTPEQWGDAVAALDEH